MKKIIVKTVSKSYLTFIGTNILNSLPELIRKYNLPERTFFIIDKKVGLLYSPLIQKILGAFKEKSYVLFVNSSERLKSFTSVKKIVSALYEREFSRDTVVIAIGGGTIGDVAGFVASTYMRGIPIVHIPTTLLSAVDSSIGGKTAINFKNAKNLVGSFYQPSLVLVDTNFFKSLSNNELFSGLGEVVKYSYLVQSKFYDELLSNYKMLMNRDLKFLTQVVYDCIKIKSAVVSQDEQDISGLRRILNFGHTFAHAFESISAYKISHGKAVLQGIISALFLSLRKGLITKKELDYMVKLPLMFKSSLRIKSSDYREIRKAMKYDKKNRAGDLQFVLIKNFGEILIDITVDNEEIYWAVKNAGKILV